MKTVVLDVRDFDDALSEISEKWESGESEETARISFDAPELLWEVLNARRWALLKALCGAGPISPEDAARKTGGDFRAVRADADALVRAGLLNRRPDGKVEFPFDAVKVEFFLHAA